jgi:hypothetical protein
VFHNDRLPIQKETWIADAPPGVTVVFMSETADAAIPTVDLIAKWPDVLKKNSETATGHCAKFTAIMYELQKEHGEKKWFVVVDDDTILSVRRLMHTLSWYDHDKPYYVGQRYSCDRRTCSMH